MTAPAAAPAAGPIAPAAPRAASQPAVDRLAFTAMLDSLPGGTAKAGASTVEEQPRVSKESREDASSGGKSAGHSLLSDSALLAALPFALGVASALDAGSEATDDASALAPSLAKASGGEADGASVDASGGLTAVARLTGERAFHFGASRTASAIAARGLMGEASFSLAGASGQDLAAQMNLSGESAAAGLTTATTGSGANASSGAAAASTPIAAHTTRALLANRATAARAATHEGARSGWTPEAATSPPIVRTASPAAAATTTESSPKGAGGRPPDPATFAAPLAAQADPFGTQLAAPLAAATSFQPDGSTGGAADVAPRASVLGPSPAPSAQPVREIDVDLSPGGLENVSMTMRLAGEKLSVVIRAASSQTLGSIEGARDAIADRLAAIGQPLDSLIVKQTGVNADGNTNGNATSADDGAPGDRWRSAQGSGDRSSSNDASLSRRGAGRDRGF